ncbi:hypothetical protein TNCV_2452611 [Trichonephila clavipes]|nr:hypothetical protein TNCV_2452611 [Trichonephila clavipes]
MSPRRNKEKFQKLKEFERGRIISLPEGGFSYNAIGARAAEQFHSDASLEVVDLRAPNNSKTGSGRRTGEYFPPLQFNVKIVEVELGGVAIYRPFGEFHRAKSDYVRQVALATTTT